VIPSFINLFQHSLQSLSLLLLTAMKVKSTLVVAASFGSLVACAATPKPVQPRERGGLYKRQHSETTHSATAQLDWWNYANETSPGATADGKIGVIIEPDIVVGRPGIDGGVQKVCEIHRIQCSRQVYLQTQRDSDRIQ
jgi:hypothetical protein